MVITFLRALLDSYECLLLLFMIPVCIQKPLSKQYVKRIRRGNRVPVTCRYLSKLTLNNFINAVK